MNVLERRTQWLALCGADDDVGDVARPWFTVAAHPSDAPPAPLQQPPLAAKATTDPAVAAALARSAKSLPQLAALVAAYDGCALKKTAMSTVFADGDPASRVMVIGEAPGAEEDRSGRPFVGQAGQLLDRMLAAIGRGRTNPAPAGAYITNMVFWRPPGNRNPSPQELEQCRPFVDRHIALVRPRAILALGAIASQSLLRSDQSITRMRGSWQQIMIEGEPVPVMPTFHPAFLLRSPAQKAQSWLDLLAFKAAIDAPEASHAD